MSQDQIERALDAGQDVGMAYGHGDYDGSEAFAEEFWTWVDTVAPDGSVERQVLRETFEDGWTVGYNMGIADA